MILQTKLSTPLGALWLVASHRGLTGLFWKMQNFPMMTSENAALSSSSLILKKALIELKQYLEGKRTRFKIPLDLEGTDFQKHVWAELIKIPYGKTCSYKEIAIKISNPKAVRAVGSANGKNPVCIIIPCHRVIADDGSNGGYSGGQEKKRWLLRLEQNH